MAQFRGKIEDKYYKLHEFTVEAETKESAEAEAIRKVAFDLNLKYGDLEVIVCSQVLTAEDVAEYSRLSSFDGTKPPADI